LRESLKVLFLASEAVPLIKVGGLGDVAGSLPYALRSLDPAWLDGERLDVRLAIPFHAAIRSKLDRFEKITEYSVDYSSGPILAEVFFTEIHNLPIYLIGSRLFGPGEPVYTTDNYRDGVKYTFFTLAALQLPRYIGWKPDILHSNDWHTAVGPYISRFDPNYADLHPTPTVLTIHNLPYLGGGSENALAEFGITPSTDDQLPAWASTLPLPLGLSAADRIVAVSPSYAEEILTPEFGCGLELFLQNRRQSVMGILNGLDQDNWDPATDKALSTPFNLAHLPERSQNKDALIKAYSLNPGLDIPLLIIISRMDYQKGIDLAIEALSQIANSPWQAIILGTGDRTIEASCQHLQETYPDRVRAVLKFDAQLSRLMYGGGDMILMPSRYEPCGLAQMIAMRYGCIPVARATGGLKDTIQDALLPGATGFLFKKSRAKDLAETITRAFRYFSDRTKWREMQQRGMQMDFSWQRSALAYAQVYRSLLEEKQ
jgi:starch synthase